MSTQNYELCQKCKNYEFSLSKGILCGSTHEKPSFIDNCEKFELDPQREKLVLDAQRRASVTAARRREYEEGDFFAPERKALGMGRIGGLILMIIAAVWFFAGLENDIIFYYPPILFLIGLGGLIFGGGGKNKRIKRREKMRSSYR